MEPNDHEKKLEKLSRAITEAILRSNDVRNILLNLQKEDLIGSKSFLMLVMRVDGLADLVESIQRKKGKSDSRKSSKKGNDQYIDGKKLSRSEVEFYEYLAKNFDQAEWLNDNGLILE